MEQQGDKHSYLMSVYWVEAYRTEKALVDCLAGGYPVGLQEAGTGQVAPKGFPEVTFRQMCEESLVSRARW